MAAFIKIKNVKPNSAESPPITLASLDSDYGPTLGSATVIPFIGGGTLQIIGVVDPDSPNVYGQLTWIGLNQPEITGGPAVFGAAQANGGLPFTLSLTVPNLGSLANAFNKGIAHVSAAVFQAPRAAGDTTGITQDQFPFAMQFGNYSAPTIPKSSGQTGGSSGQGAGTGSGQI